MVVILVGAWWALRGSGPDVIDADDRPVSSDLALEAVEAWSNLDDREPMDIVRVLWEGRARGNGRDVLDTVVLESGDRIVTLQQAAVRDDWGIDRGQSRPASPHALAVGRGYLLPTFDADRIRVWCDHPREPSVTRRSGGGYGGTLPVDDGYVSESIRGCVALHDADPGDASAVWFLGSSGEPPLVDRSDPDGTWGALTRRSDSNLTHQAANVAFDHLRTAGRDSDRVIADVTVDIVASGTGQGRPGDESVAAVALRADRPAEEGLQAVVAAAVSSPDADFSVVLGERAAHDARPALAARWIDEEESPFDARPFLLYAAFDELDPWQLRLGTEDVDLDSPVGLVTLPASTRRGLGPVRFSLIALDDEQHPVTPMGPPQSGSVGWTS